MGQYAVIFVIAAFIFGAVLLFNAQLSAEDANQDLSAYQVDRFARGITLVGLKEAERNLNDATDTWDLWTTDPTAAQALFGVPTTSHDGGTYSVAIDSFEFGLLPTDPDIVWLTASGTYDGWDAASGMIGTTNYTVKATYETGLTDLGVPPGFRDAIISDMLVDLRGNVQISGGIHSNDELASSGGAFDVHGQGSYTGSSTANEDEFSDGIVYSDSVAIPVVPIPPPSADIHYDTGAPLDLDVTTDPAGLLVDGWFSILGHGDEGDAYVLYVDGDLDITGDVRLLGYSRIYVNGAVTMGGNVVLAPVSAAAPDLSQDVLLAQTWVEDYLPNGSMIGIFATGDITISGTAFVVASLYTYGAVKFVGGGNKLIIGGITAFQPLDMRGNSKIYYTEASEEIIDPGINLLVPNGIRLIGYREWAERP